MKSIVPILLFIISAFTYETGQFNGQANKEIDTIKYYRLGVVPDLYEAHAWRLIADKYQIEIFNLGCMIDDTIWATVESLNRPFYENIEREYEGSLEEEIYDLIQLHKRLEQLLIIYFNNNPQDVSSNHAELLTSYEIMDDRIGSYMIYLYPNFQLYQNNTCTARYSINVKQGIVVRMD